MKGVSFRTYLATALVAACLFSAWLLSGFGGPGVVRAMDNLALVVVPLLAAAALFRTALRGPVKTRRAWALLAAGTASWAAGNAVWSWYELVLGVDVPFPSLADVGYLLMIPLTVGGLLAFPSAPRRATGRIVALFDGLIVASSLLFVSWAIVLGPVYRAASGTLLEKAIGLAYPFGDVVLASIVVLVAQRTRPHAREPFLLVGAGLLSLAVADSGFALLTTTGAYETGALVDIGWFVGFLLLGLAAIRALTAPLERPDDPRGEIGALQEILPFAPAFLALVVSGWYVLERGPLGGFLFWNAAACVFFVLTRQLLLVREIGEAGRRRASAEEARLQLLHNVVHDIGTPLTAIRLQLHLASLDTGPDRRDRSLAVVGRNTDQIGRLVGDLRDLANLESGRLKMRMAPTDADALVAHAVETLLPAAGEKKVKLTSTTGSGRRIFADPARITQVLTNLIGNAVKFAPTGGTVDVEARTDRGHLVVRIRDTGPGLSPDQIAALFQPFARVHDERKGPAGSGLGLYISKGIVEEHAGALWCESDGAGTGATFVFRLPLVTVARPDRPDGAPSPTG